MVVGPGDATFFWLDNWLGDRPLADTFPALFSHCLRPNSSVAMALTGIQGVPTLSLRPRLTSAAQSELLVLHAQLSDVTLQPLVPDRRSVRGSSALDLSASALYSLTFSHLPDDGFSTCIWDNAAPPRCKSFLWLLHHGKLNTNARLHSRGADNDGICSFCDQVEDVLHLFLGCHRAQSFWQTFGITSASFLQVEYLWLCALPGPDCTSEKVRSTILTGLLWNLWKCRNAKIFNQALESNGVVLQRCAADLLLWKHRATSLVDKFCLEQWSLYLSCNF